MSNSNYLKIMVVASIAFITILILPLLLNLATNEGERGPQGPLHLPELPPTPRAPVPLTPPITHGQNCTIRPLTEDEKARALAIALEDPLVKSFLKNVTVKRVGFTLRVDEKGCMLGADVNLGFEPRWVEIEYYDRFFLEGNVSYKGFTYAISVSVDLRNNKVISYFIIPLKVQVKEILKLNLSEDVREVIEKSVKVALDHVNERYRHAVGREVTVDDLYTRGVFKVNDRCFIGFTVEKWKGVRDGRKFIDLITVSIDYCRGYMVEVSQYFPDVEVRG